MNNVRTHHCVWSNNRDGVGAYGLTRRDGKHKEGKFEFHSTRVCLPPYIPLFSGHAFVDATSNSRVHGAIALTLHLLPYIPAIAIYASPPISRGKCTRPSSLLLLMSWSSKFINGNEGSLWNITTRYENRHSVPSRLSELEKGRPTP